MSLSVGAKQPRSVWEEGARYGIVHDAGTPSLEGREKAGRDELGTDGWVQSQAIVDGGYFGYIEQWWDESTEGGP